MPLSVSVLRISTKRKRRLKKELTISVLGRCLPHLRRSSIQYHINKTDEDSKTNTKNIIGTAGTQAILEAISTSRPVGTVSIGGINLSNVQRVLYQSQSSKKGVDGVAIVSAIVAADDPAAAAAEFSKAIKSPPAFATVPRAPRANEASSLLAEVPGIVQKIVQAHPLVHSMINYVVANFVANVVLAMGASPIMAPYGDEAADLAGFDGALVINMGTLTKESVANNLIAMKGYNSRGNPVIYDPVGAAATQIRRDAVKQLMSGGYFDLIKGNESEIKHIAGAVSKQRGVDSGSSSMNESQKARLVCELARRESMSSLYS